ncbi:lysoplasmalogenase [Streptosporangium amethystogenes]|uniref:lysoplasmalogenase n=1 Tax=Streptosporangium amethystogenes TaxID=2002 RepID=UPI0004C7AD1E|nr:lysoplasmalogenase [Streptosporangium amethystogenes]
MQNDVLRAGAVSRILLAAFWLCSAVHLVLVAVGEGPMNSVTKALLMPLLAAWVLARRGPRLLVAALLLSWGGDVALEIDGLFLAGMALFAGAHVCYVTCLVREGALRALRRRPAIPVVYGVLWAGMVLLLWPGLGDLRLPVAVYSLLLTATAVTAAGLGPRIGAGGALFLLSDALIAFGLADLPRPPMTGLVIMTTYVAAQYLLASGIVDRLRS